MTLVGWWPLHRTNGDAIDLSGNNNHGTLKNNPTRGVWGKAGLQAYDFDGSDDYLDCGNPSALNVNPTITVCAWFRTDKTKNQSTGGKKDNTSPYAGWTVETDGNNGYIKAILKDTNENSISATTSNSYNDNNWHHHAVKFDDTDPIKIYIDGELKTQSSNDASTLGTITTSAKMLIGERDSSTNSRAWNGQITDYRIYDHALTPQEIQTLYDWGHGRYASPPGTRNGDTYTPSNGKAYYPFNGDVNDKWNNNDGTDNTSAGYTNNSIRGSKAKKFDGNDDWVDMGSGWMPTSNFTISLWVNKDNTNSSQRVFDYDGSRIVIGYGDVTGKGNIGSNEWAFATYDGSNYTSLTGSTRTGNWLHLVGAYDGSKMYLYENGRLHNAKTASTPDTTNDEVGVGANDNGSGAYYGGLIDDIRIYNTALTKQEVFELYQWGTRGRDIRKLTTNAR